MSAAFVPPAIATLSRSIWFGGLGSSPHVVPLLVMPMTYVGIVLMNPICAAFATSATAPQAFGSPSVTSTTTTV